MAYRSEAARLKKRREEQQAHRERMKKLRKPDRRLVEHLALKLMVFHWLKKGDRKAIDALEDALSEALALQGFDPRSVDDRLDQLFTRLRVEYLDATLAERVGCPD